MPKSMKKEKIKLITVITMIAMLVVLSCFMFFMWKYNGANQTDQLSTEGAEPVTRLILTSKNKRIKLDLTKDVQITDLLKYDFDADTLSNAGFSEAEIANIHNPMLKTNENHVDMRTKDALTIAFGGVNQSNGDVQFIDSNLFYLWFYGADDFSLNQVTIGSTIEDAMKQFGKPSETAEMGDGSKSYLWTITIDEVEYQITTIADKNNTICEILLNAGGIPLQTSNSTKE